MSECVKLNNKGIKLEKEENIDEAIDVYEQNIKEGCYPARHSFDRLIILYRKRKDYTNEIRVIQRAIDVFPKDLDYKIRYEKVSNLINSKL